MNTLLLGQTSLVLFSSTSLNQNNINSSIKCQLNTNAGKGFTSRKPPQNAKENTQLDIKTTATNSKDRKKNEDDEIPQEVVYRIIKRILISVGGPMALGLASLKFFGYVKEEGIWDVPIGVVFGTLFLTFGASALGIAYGALSSSLDANREGSLLGLEEIQENWVEMWKEENEEKEDDIY
ncbi:uncharacterized protein PAM68-like [Mercurialis annua]|uniref:uncharacterized protein PAM68-like n=1 Tax=Mercurialis annua TaxID=3986 RepID=UPI0021610198|nr:uncharacterized protein PAM68-like [Mercurialis annua]